MTDVSPQASADAAIARHRAMRLAPCDAVAACDRLRTIFRDAVRVAGPAHYGPAQVVAWAAGADDVERWRRRLADGATFVARSSLDAGAITGFAVVAPADRVDLLYVDPASHRLGVASALLAAVERAARSEGVDALTSDASVAAYGVFASCGFTLVAWEDAVHGGETFRRAAMRKVLR